MTQGYPTFTYSSLVLKPLNRIWSSSHQSLKSPPPPKSVLLHHLQDRPGHQGLRWIISAKGCNLGDPCQGHLRCRLITPGNLSGQVRKAVSAFTSSHLSICLATLTATITCKTALCCTHIGSDAKGNRTTVALVS